MKRRLDNDEEDDDTLSESDIVELFEAKQAKSIKQFQTEQKIQRYIEAADLVYISKKQNLKRYLRSMDSEQRANALKITDGFQTENTVHYAHPEVIKKNLRILFKIVPSKLGSDERVIVQAKEQFDLLDISEVECVRKVQPFDVNDIASNYFVIHGLVLQTVKNELPFRILLRSNLHSMALRHMNLMNTKNNEEVVQKLMTPEYNRLPDMPDLVVPGKERTIAGGIAAISAQYNGTVSGKISTGGPFEKTLCKALYGYDEKTLYNGIYEFAYLSPGNVNTQQYCLMPANHAVVTYLSKSDPKKKGIIFKPDGTEIDDKSPLYVIVPEHLVRITIQQLQNRRQSLPICEMDRLNFEITRLNPDAPTKGKNPWSDLNNTVHGTTKEDMDKEYSVEVIFSMYYTCFRKDTGDKIVTLPSPITSNFSNEQELRDMVHQIILEQQQDRKTHMTLQQLRMMET